MRIFARVNQEIPQIFSNTEGKMWRRLLLA